MEQVVVPSVSFSIYLCISIAFTGGQAGKGMISKSEPLSYKIVIFIESLPPPLEKNPVYAPVYVESFETFLLIIPFIFVKMQKYIFYIVYFGFVHFV